MATPRLGLVVEDKPTELSCMCNALMYTRIEQLKTQVQQKHQNGSNAPSPPSGANGSDCTASGRLFCLFT